MGAETSVKFANGFEVNIFGINGEIVISLINPNGYVVSDIELKGKQLEEFKELVKQ